MWSHRSAQPLAVPRTGEPNVSPKLIERTEQRQLQKISPEQLSSELMRRLPLEFLKKQRAIPILLDKNEPAVALADP